MHISHLFQRVLCYFSIDSKDPCVVVFSAKAFEIPVKLATHEDASDLLRVLTQTESSNQNKCAICHKQLSCGRCLQCERCHLLVCDLCGGTRQELTCYGDEAESEEEGEPNPLLCRPCFASRDYKKYAKPQFHPIFPQIVQHPYDPNSSLPAGWGCAMLSNGRRYFFNPLLWLSSWSIPQDAWSNDCPVGYSKYYDMNGRPFLYDAKSKQTVENPLKREFVKKCPCCKYDCTDVKKMMCPACNSIIRSFYCLC